MWKQLEFDFNIPILKMKNNRWEKTEIRNCNVCGKDYLLYTKGSQVKTQEASPNFCSNKCWKIGFVLIMKNSIYFHKLCEINDITISEISKIEEESSKNNFPFLHRVNNLIKE